MIAHHQLGARRYGARVRCLGHHYIEVGGVEARINGNAEFFGCERAGLHHRPRNARDSKIRPGDDLEIRKWQRFCKQCAPNKVAEVGGFKTR